MLVEAEIWTVARTDQGNAILIRPIGAEVAVPIFIGQLEAQSILIGLGNVPMPRPYTHDLFTALLTRMNVKLEKIEIIALKDAIFFAQLVLNRNGETFILDSRPSDSIALAVRLKCPIFIAETVVDEAGIPLSAITEEGKGKPLNPKEKEKEILESQLSRLLEEENYEEAAKIRDRLREIDLDNPEG